MDENLYVPFEIVTCDGTRFGRKKNVDRSLNLSTSEKNLHLGPIIQSVTAISLISLISKKIRSIYDVCELLWAFCGLAG